VGPTWEFQQRAPGPIEHPLEAGLAPGWATGWGDDEFGPFADLEVRGDNLGRVRQRFRWIPPGTFWMGSPAGEPGRYSNEGPRHLVTLSRGYWMAETPCTQALWEAVMGENPSRFRNERHPVERVSWLEVQKFLARLNELGEGGRFDLPSEAQWEYACRADSATAVYPAGTGTGELKILGEHNAPALDAIAWYGGNSEAPAEIKDAYDSSAWREKQRPHERASTQAVGLKLPNAWGLYDMLGNVWEWCLDRYENYEERPMIDPSHVGQREDADVSRVFRGGSWSDHARLVRCAVRSALPAAYRDDDLGFRLVREQERW